VAFLFEWESSKDTHFLPFVSEPPLRPTPAHLSLLGGQWGGFPLHAACITAVTSLGSDPSSTAG
jgi:hypothetical protein